MLAIRKLDLKLIEKLLPQLEEEEIQAEIALELAEKAVFLARQRRDEAHDHVLQMRGEYDSAQELERSPALLGDGQGQAQLDVPTSPDPPQASFWDMQGFSWRQFLPVFIEREDIPMTYNDVKAKVGLTDQEEKRLDSTISSALSHLAKIGSLLSYSFPGIRGQFYGVPKFFEDGTLKEEYLQKVSEKVGRISPYVFNPFSTTTGDIPYENE